MTIIRAAQATIKFLVDGKELDMSLDSISDILDADDAVRRQHRKDFLHQAGCIALMKRRSRG